MKKVLFASLFAASAVFGLSSCVNGDYDATPTTNNGTPNPLNQNNGSNGSTSSTGNITAKVDGTSYTFSGKYQVIGSQRIIAGTIADGGTGRTLSVSMTNYSGAKTYNLPADGLGNYGYFPISDPSNTTTYSTASTSMPGSGTITVTSDDNNTMKGTFSFTAGDAAGGSGKVTVTEGSFNVGQ